MKCFISRVVGFLNRRIRDAARMDILSTVFINFLSPHVMRNNGGLIKIYRHTKIYFEKGSKLIVENGILCIGGGKPLGAKNASLIRIQKGATVHSFGDNTIEYDADILLRPNATFEMKRGAYLNCKSVIRCSSYMSIGEDSITATELEVRDSDGHELNGIVNTNPTIIGAHVWIGARVTDLEGVTIGDGSVIGVCSLVTRSIPENSLAYGSPARVQKENVVWKY